MGDESVLERILVRDEEPKDLPLELLQRITKDFSKVNKIGEGGFGEVYKGELRNGITVAVKRIEVTQFTIDDVSFRRELDSLMKINHQNVVRFLGFCSNTHHITTKEAGKINLVNVRERLLCFEYIRNGSLDKHITDELRGLEWESRYAIISGICKGLFYLHEEKKIVHMDLKPRNILLDDDNVPKITDFGLSRSNEKSHTMGQRFGTPGYVAPEYEKDGKTKFKCDIYSLGVIIIELVTGRRSVPHKNNVLRRWRHRWNNPPTLLQYEQVTRCIEIAAQCREQEPEARPSIPDIIGFLKQSECADGHISQESTYLDDDMLGIEPLELKFDGEMPWSVKLTNNTKACFAFSIERLNKLYTIQPDKGIVIPGSECLVRIAVMEPQVTQNANKLIVRSTKVNEDLRVKDITEDLFHEVASKVVDEVYLMVVYEPVEAVYPKYKAINSIRYEDALRGQPDLCNFHPPENFSHRQSANMTYLLKASDRAMDVTRGAMGSLLHKLGELRKVEFNMETNAKEDIDSLSKELVKMQPVLRKVSEVQQDNLNDLVKLWASNVRDMSYDLEDFIGGFLVHNEPYSNTSSFRELTHELCFPLDKGKSHHTIRNLIKEKRKQVEDATKTCKEYKVDEVVPDSVAKAATDDLRRLVIHKQRKELVGIETPRDEIIRLFEEDGDVSNHSPKIVSIVGLGGLGKTTLAKAVYDKVKAQFSAKSFVSVGQNPDVKKVLENIICKIEKDFNVEKKDVGDLIEKLQELLEDKRYFIVIDDIWDSKAWGLIQSAFPETEHDCRVITTTRNHDVALATCSAESKYVYRIKPLNKEDSSTLFFRRTFGSKGCPDTLRKEEISIDILQRCGGMPLAINSIASLLAGKTDSTWEYVCKSLGAMTEGDDLENMKQILDLSYIHLPEHLKTCLLYVCSYPEDREIDKNDLLMKWVAEGFVHVSRNGVLDAEDVAEMYFKELINMCMIQPGRIDYNNEVLSCRVHDIILDLMKSKSSKENFIHVIDGSKDETGEIRRVFVPYNDKEDTKILGIIDKLSLSHVRSVIVHRQSLVLCFLEFKYVRVLHLERYMGIDLSGINRLFLLRYLKIAAAIGSRYELKLPNQIGGLQQLETIDLEYVSPKNYPSDIVSLPWLSHLSYTGIHGVVLPDRIDRLKSLRTLVGVDLFKSSVENAKDISKLTNLRKLHICLNGDREDHNLHMNILHSSISMLSQNLRVLTFEYCHDRYKVAILDFPGWSRMTLFPQGSHIRELHLGGCRFPRCPEWISQLHGLYKFCIEVREVADGMSIVAGLPSLSEFSLCIYLGQEQQKEESVVIPGGGAFKALKHLGFWCSKASLSFEVGAMPKLEELVIAFRFHMVRGLLPVGIQHLPAPTLKKIFLTMDYNNIMLRGSKYQNSDQYKDGLRKHVRKLRPMLRGAFKTYHPDANIVVNSMDAQENGIDLEEDMDYADCGCVDEEGDYEQDDEGGGDEEDHYCSEQHDEVGSRENGSQNSAQFHPDHTRQLVELFEVQQDSSGMSINTDTAPALVVDTLLHLAVGFEGRQSGQHLESLQLPFTSLLASSPFSLQPTLAPCSSLDRAKAVANFPVNISNGILVNAVGQYFDFNQAPDQLNDEEILELNEDIEPTSHNCSSCILQGVINLVFTFLLRIQAICNSCLRS